MQTHPEELETSLYLSYGLGKDYHLMPEIQRSRSLPKSNQLLFGMGSVCSGQFDRNPFISFRGRLPKERHWKKLTFLLKQDMVSVSMTILRKFNFSLHLHVLFFFLAVTCTSTGHSVGTRRMKLGTEVDFVCVDVHAKRELGNGKSIITNRRGVGKASGPTHTHSNHFARSAFRDSCHENLWEGSLDVPEFGSLIYEPLPAHWSTKLCQPLAT